MKPLFDPGELQPCSAIPNLTTRLCFTLETLAPDAASRLPIAAPSCGDRLGILAGLLCRGFAPADDAATILDVCTDELDDASIRAALEPVPAERTTPLIISTDLHGIGEPREVTIAADWGFYLDHVACSSLAALASPLNVPWILTNHCGEFVQVKRTRFHHIRGIALYERFPLRDRTPVLKPQYVVLFDDGSHWLSGDLRDPSRRTEHDGAMRVLAALTGVPIATGEVLPTDLATKRPP